MSDPVAFIFKDLGLTAKVHRRAIRAERTRRAREVAKAARCLERMRVRQASLPPRKPSSVRMQLKRSWRRMFRGGGE